MVMVSRSPIPGHLYLLPTIHTHLLFLLLPLLSTRPHRISHTLPIPSLTVLKSCTRRHISSSRRHRSTLMTADNMSQRAHQQYPPPPGYQPQSRESMVKRESDDVTLPQLRRPNSTGNGPEQPLPPPPPHAGPHPPGHMEERRHMSYDNGPGPQMYRHQTYPPPPPTPLPPHPQPPPTPYDQSPMYPPPMGPDGPYPITTYTAASKRKSQRASQACESCRQLKAKCDENKPCKNCTDKNINCQYRDPAPKQQDKATQDILDAMKSMLQSYDEKFSAGLGEVRSEIRELRGAIQVGSSHSMQEPPELDDYVKEEPRPATPQPIADVDETMSSSSPGDDIGGDAPDTQSSAAKRMRILENEEENMDPPGEPVQPQPPPFPHNHTTPAGRLLMWPAVRKIVKPLLDRERVKYIEIYPQRYEEDRGELPLFGRGEGSTSRSVDRDSTLDYIDMADDSSVGDHPSPSGGTDWGPIGGLSPHGGFANDSRSQTPREGTLDFDPVRVWEYVNAYMNYIQNMHPLIPPKDLNAMVTTFLGEVNSKKQKPVATFANSQPSFDHEKKRKRSPVPNGVEPGPAPKRPRPQRSVQHALVLLVLALGKICTWRDRKLPDPPEKETPNSGSPLVRNGHITSPNHGSPPSSAVSQSPGQAGLPSPKDHERPGASRRSSMQASGVQAPTSAASPAPPKKNYEIIPGLDYFAFASDILGNHFGSYKLNYIQAHILACLYYGQLGRVIPSFRHIRFACSAIIDKLQPSMDRLKKAAELASQKARGEVPAAAPENEGPEIERNVVIDNKLLVAFWSCCQLESDILAELNLIPSGILQYEEILPYPDLMVLQEKLGFSDAVAFSYAAQLYLRKRLNRISGSLYDPQKRPDAKEQKKILEEIEEDLGSRSNVWLGMYKFDRNDPPARDILSARIRAKFWGANVITYRPSIKTVLDFSHKRSNAFSEDSERAIPHEDASGWATVRSDARSPSDIDGVVFENARKGIDAVIKSTMAFHGLEDKRFIITNVFGTAHAQWGNLITLAAAYHDPLLGDYVDERQLRQLLRKTIEFFEIVAQDSSSLAVDLRVLQGLEERLPSKEQLRTRPSLMPPAPYENLPMPSYASSGPTPQSAAGPSPITPGDMTQGHPTPMEY
ncbi:hypothetical protein J7T55_001112 [Diaporthe amygdali]|uniref:uncharacterized protein n=1 Tax=Phomopsis amygdali TaxID=1214568 RepID=UPI0022FF1EAE|nr:uncharacterized protein J7T55_001112 [Diaporthe amygdali]KAJ0120255.1 hypothetical protein J7T55_001112 [Diaporthe amygdali]